MVNDSGAPEYPCRESTLTFARYSLCHLFRDMANYIVNDELVNVVTNHLIWLSLRAFSRVLSPAVSAGYFLTARVFYGTFNTVGILSTISEFCQSVIEYSENYVRI